MLPAGYLNPLERLLDISPMKVMTYTVHYDPFFIFFKSCLPQLLPCGFFSLLTSSHLRRLACVRPKAKWTGDSLRNWTGDLAMLNLLLCSNCLSQADLTTSLAFSYLLQVENTSCQQLLFSSGQCGVSS